MTYLRKCYVCGKEARTLDDLNLFGFGKHHKYGRQNLCISCKNERRRKGNVWDQSKLESTKIRAKTQNKQRVFFKGRRVHLNYNPRTNVCSLCGKKYPEELKRQTHIHHKRYDGETPLEHTVELCASCHVKYHLSLTENNRFREAY